MVKIILGVVFILGGLSGNLVLIGTKSGVALAVFGLGLILWGVMQVRQRNS